MRALYLYFTETAKPSGTASSARGATMPVEDGPLTPIRPGAFSLWMESRERAAAEAADTTDRGAVRRSPLGSGQEREGAR